jgi:hypothetical protein
MLITVGHAMREWMAFQHFHFVSLMYYKISREISTSNGMHCSLLLVTCSGWRALGKVFFQVRILWFYLFSSITIADHPEILLLDTVLELTFILKAYMKWLCCSGYFVVMHSESWSFIRWLKHFKKNIFTVKLPSLTGIGIQLLLWPEYQYVGNKFDNVVKK